MPNRPVIKKRCFSPISLLWSYCLLERNSSYIDDTLLFERRRMFKCGRVISGNFVNKLSDKSRIFKLVRLVKTSFGNEFRKL